ncbi:MAG: glycosyltransferase [Alphaproteobacteria bacterium]
MRRDEPVDILFVIDRLAVGGAERSAINLANGFAARGYRVAFLVMKAGGGMVDHVSNKVAVHTLNNQRIRKALLPARRKIRDLRPKVILSFMLNVNIMTILAAKLAGTGSITIVTEHNQLELFRQWGRAVRWILPISPFIYALADQIVCCSPGIRDAWAARPGLSRKKVTSILNPLVTSSVPEAAAREPTCKWGRNDTVPLIAAAGRLCREKDFATLIRAFALLRSRRPARLVIMGDGDERDALSTLARELGVSDDVDMPGFIENPYSMFRRADIVAVSSATEGFPSVVVEALACGTGIVMTACLSRQDQATIDPWIQASVPVGNHRQLADALDLALRNTPDPALMRAQVRHLTDDAAIDQYESIMFGDQVNKPRRALPSRLHAET